MNGFLLDTSLLSAVAPDRPPLPPQAAQWLRAEAARLYLPTLALQEIRKGIRKLHRAGGHERADRLLAWLSGLVETYSDRLLALGPAEALEAGIIEDQAMEAGRSPGLADCLIAGIAQAHGLTVATANERHFRALGIPVINPLAAP